MGLLPSPRPWYLECKREISPTDRLICKFVIRNKCDRNPRLVASLIITGSETEKISQKSIESVMEDHLLLTSRALSAKMELQLASLENAVVTFMANAVAQASQKNSPNILKYQQGKDFSGRIDSPNSICSHIGDGKVDRLEGTVLQGNATLDFSIYTAPETSDFLKERNDSFVMNYFFRRMWEEHNSVVSMYTGKKLDRNT